MKLKFNTLRAIALFTFTLAISLSARADTVTDWNRIAVQEVVIAGAVPVQAALSISRWSS